MTIFTLGHSTRPLDELVSLLQENAVRRLVDVRTVPRSRHNPQFNAEVMPETMASHGIAYEHRPELGGLRKPRRDSPNMGWRNESFRGYADYMQTAGFEAALVSLIEAAERGPLAIMCAEAVPWRCHRSLIADALTVRGIETQHILATGKRQAHRLTAFAQVDGTHLSYPFALEG